MPKKADDQVTLNEKAMDRSEFEKKREELEKKPGVKVVKIDESTFATRIKG